MNWIIISIQLIGGLAIFLYGMFIASEGLKKSASHRLKDFLRKVTHNQWYGAMAGILLAAILQSSTAATVMIVGFVNAGIISLRRAMGVMLGSAVGTTLTVQLIAFNITDYALIFVSVGVVIYLVSQRFRAHGSILLGFGFVFFGMGLMIEAMVPVQSNAAFMEYLMILSENPFLAVLAAATFTAIVQNSAATIALAMALSAHGPVSLEAAIFLVYGANLGTVVTAMISSLTGSKDAQRAAVAHAFFKLIGVVLFFPFTGLFGNALSSLGGDTERQIANAHTIFNLVNLLLLLPFCNRFADWMVQLMPERESQPKHVKHIDRETVHFPTVGLLQARLELERAQRMIRENMFPQMLEMLRYENTGRSVLEGEHILNHIYKAIYHHLQQIMEQDLTDKESGEALKLLYFNNDMERTANILKDMTRAVGKLNEGNKTLSNWEKEQLEGLYKEVVHSYDAAMLAVKNNDEHKALAVIRGNPKILRMEREIRYQHFNNEPGTSSTVSIVFSDLMNGLLRIHQHSVNISHTYLGMV